MKKKENLFAGFPFFPMWFYYFIHFRYFYCQICYWFRNRDRRCAIYLDVRTSTVRSWENPGTVEGGGDFLLGFLFSSTAPEFFQERTEHLFADSAFFSKFRLKLTILFLLKLIITVHQSYLQLCAIPRKNTLDLISGT